MRCINFSTANLQPDMVTESSHCRLGTTTTYFNPEQFRVPTPNDIPGRPGCVVCLPQSNFTLNISNQFVRNPASCCVFFWFLKSSVTILYNLTHAALPCFLYQTNQAINTNLRNFIRNSQITYLGRTAQNVNLEFTARATVKKRQ
jgi:hypothetical protein